MDNLSSILYVYAGQELNHTVAKELKNEDPEDFLEIIARYEQQQPSEDIIMVGNNEVWKA